MFLASLRAITCKHARNGIFRAGLCVRACVQHLLSKARACRKQKHCLTHSCICTCAEHKCKQNTRKRLTSHTHTHARTHAHHNTHTHTRAQSPACAHAAARKRRLCTRVGKQAGTQPRAGTGKQASKRTCLLNTQLSTAREQTAEWPFRHGFSAIVFRQAMKPFPNVGNGLHLPPSLQGQAFHVIACLVRKLPLLALCLLVVRNVQKSDLKSWPRKSGLAL